MELEYTQILKSENGVVKYGFPLKAQGESTPVDDTKISLNISSKAGLRMLWSPTHTVSTKRESDYKAAVSFDAKDAIPDKDFLLYYSISDKDLAANLLTHKSVSDDGYFLLTLTPPVKSPQIAAKDVVLVADTSGSMAGEKIEQAKKALKYVVTALNPDDRFGLVQFNTDVEQFKSSLVPATKENREAALKFIDELDARGGTNISGALEAGATILSQQSNRPAYMVFVTDGEPTVGETDASKIIKAQSFKRDIRVFDFGVGYDVNTKLLNKLSAAHHGTSQYVEPNESLETSL